MLNRVTRFAESLRTSVSVSKDAELPRWMRSAIGRLALRVRNTPFGRLPNPLPLLGCRVRYFTEGHLRFLLEEILFDRCYRFTAQRPDPLIVDCGSNIGISILFFKALYPDSRIIAFEPDPTTFQLLVENISENGLTNIELHNVALCDRDKSIEFFIAPDEEGSLTMSVHRERAQGTAITVRGKRLSHFIPDRVDLLKMDIEGSEGSVFGELEASEALPRIHQIHMEYHHHVRPEEDKMSEILALLERNGFGYQVRARSPKWATPAAFQDVAFFAYRKGDPSTESVQPCRSQQIADLTP